jgi:outer membrane protein insertion porin family
VCSARELPRAPASATLSIAPEPDARVVRIAVGGTERVSPSLLRGAIQHPTGAPFDADRVAKDVHAIWALEVFDDVSVSWVPARDGIELRYQVRERARIGRVVALGDERRAFELGIDPGKPYDPAYLNEQARDLEETLRHAGHSRARVELRGRANADRVDVCVEVRPGPRATIARLEFVGNSGLSAAVLRAQMHTDGGKINTPGGVYRSDVLERDLLFFAAAYYDRGMLDARVQPRVVESAERVTIAVEIEEGRVYRVGKLDLRTKLQLPVAQYRKLLGISSGDVFSRQRFVAGIARIEALGAGKLVVEPKTELIPERALADVVLEISPR